MDDVDLILTLTGSLAAALVFGYVALRLGLSPIVGYLIAGLAVGPNTPGFVANTHLADQLAEVGVVLLMFGVGLQFHAEELLAVRRVAVPGAIGRSLAAAALGTLVGVGAGWGWSASAVFGLALSVASTVVLMRVLADAGDLHTPAGHVAVGWLVVEDLFTVLVLVLLPAVSAPGAGAAQVALAVLVALAKVGAMVGLTFVLGNRLIPWVLDRAAATRSRELFTLAVLVLALGVAVGSVKLFGVSTALGAFLAGMVVGRTEFSLRAATEALPMRDAFAVLFFVSVGMMFRPHSIIETPGTVALTLAVVMVAKPLIALALARLLGQTTRGGLPLALSTAQIGEFSFILAGTGERLGLLDDRPRDVLVAVALISITLTPILYRLVGPVGAWLGRRAGPPPGVPTRTGEVAARFHAVIVGHGPVGRTLARLLGENRIEPIVVELNAETVRRLNAEGTRAVYGDAAHPDTLEGVDVAGAVALILSAAGIEGNAEAIRAARERNPNLLIFARATYLRERAELHAAGADVVFTAEGEIAAAMTEAILHRLGATPEQLDRQRGRIRAELADTDDGGARRLPDAAARAGATVDRGGGDA